jgi:hypothetical protein
MLSSSVDVTLKVSFSEIFGEEDLMGIISEEEFDVGNKFILSSDF